jgi:putative acetyltransferase
MDIRPEVSADYGTIADLHIEAFGYRSDESTIVALLRQRHAYDAGLSLVATINGQIVGHALFNPCTIRLLDTDIRAVVLAPLAVLPAYQKKGIGSALMETGHALARTKGYTLAFLLGHPSYYPRFGYRMHAFGASTLQINAQPRTAVSKLETRFPLPEDIPALMALWELEESHVDFSMRPAAALYDWYSPSPHVDALVYLRAGKVVGYIRGKASHIRMFLAQDDETALAMVRWLTETTSSITLPLHPYSRSAQVLGRPESSAWDAAMALALADVPLDEYFTAIQTDKRAPGRVLWGSVFDLA